MDMKQLVHIHGGEWFDSYNEYFKYLENKEIDDPREPGMIKWRDRYEEFLEEDWLVIRPQMPSPRNAKYIEWELWFEKYIPYIEDGVILVGHSLGATFLTQYLSEKRFPKEIASLHLVAPEFSGKGGFGLKSDFVLQRNPTGSIYVYHSKDDSVVPFADAEKFKQALPEAELVVFEDRGHFLQEDFPELIERIKM